MSTESTPPKPRYDLSKLIDYGRWKPRRKNSRYPSFNRRMLAATIDSMLLLLLLPVVNMLVPLQTQALGQYSVDPNDPEAPTRFIIHMLSNHAFMQSWISNFMMQILFWCVFSAICWHFWSATPGKMLLRMKVVDAKTEGPINDLQIFLRAFGYLISASFFGLGFIWLNLNKKRRGWHDYLGDTVVITLPLLPWKKAAPPKDPERPSEAMLTEKDETSV